MSTHSRRISIVNSRYKQMFYVLILSHTLRLNLNSQTHMNSNVSLSTQQQKKMASVQWLFNYKKCIFYLLSIYSMWLKS